MSRKSDDSFDRFVLDPRLIKVIESSKGNGVSVRDEVLRIQKEREERKKREQERKKKS